jgi:hypothetical protein
MWYAATVSHELAEKMTSGGICNSNATSDLLEAQNKKVVKQKKT